MRNSWRLVVAGAIALAAVAVQASDPGAVQATDPAAVQTTDPAAVQDPPGEVDMRQPAGVSLSERNTERDTTDTLAGAGRTEVIDGAAAQAAEGRADVQPGAEARTGFGEAPGVAGEPAGAEEEQPADTAEATSLGTDTGHGTGTELAAPPARR